MNAISEVDLARFQRDGFIVVRNLLDAPRRAAMRQHVEGLLEPLQGPAEFETDVGYQGAPTSRSSDGGHTPRRLLHAYSRAPMFGDWATAPAVREHLKSMLSSERVMLSQSHHNCVMTKMPGYSSETNWHQDIRYWSFDDPELVSVWLALADERASNGGLLVIPGSHQLTLDRGRLDRDLFLRQELPENQALIDSAVPVEMKAGDVLFFHCRVFHAAGMNRAGETKMSLVYTYHGADNEPIPGTRSATYPSIPV
jgi:phytanoyl-CoA hydroxylase